MLDSNTTLTIQLSAHDCMQYSYFQTGLLQRHPLQSSLDKLQWVQNNLARVVCQRSRITDARPLLQSLHWLSIRECILYKTVLLTFKTPTRIVSTVPGRSATTSTTNKITAVLRLSTVDCTTNTNCTGGTRFLCGCAHCLERFTVQRPVMWLTADFQMPSENSLFYHRVCVTYSYISASVSSVVTALYKFYYYYYYYYALIMVLILAYCVVIERERI